MNTPKPNDNSTNTNSGNDIPTPPDNPNQKPPMYVDPNNPNDPEFNKTQPYAELEK